MVYISLCLFSIFVILLCRIRDTRNGDSGEIIEVGYNRVKRSKVSELLGEIG